MSKPCDWCGRSACKNRRGPTCVRFARMYAQEIMVEAVVAEYEPQTPSPLRLAERAASALDALRAKLATARAIIDGTTQASIAVCAERDALRSELEKLKAWHPASEPPETHRMVLVRIILYRGSSLALDAWSGYEWIYNVNVTHWREFPEGPEVTP